MSPVTFAFQPLRYSDPSVYAQFIDQPLTLVDEVLVILILATKPEFHSLSMIYSQVAALAKGASIVNTTVTITEIKRL